MKNTLNVDGATFLRLPIVDTSLALHVYDITPDIFVQVKSKLHSLYGRELIEDMASEISVPPELDFNKQRYNAADALRVIARLTRDGDGCPWDRAQTHESIRINLIEEAYEAVDAIDKRDVPNMREEFGDVFLQSILQSDIARRAGEFDFDDVCDELCKKLISRHSWIFADDSAANADEALTAWEKNKGVEKHYDGVKNQLERLPGNFPSLLYAQKTYKKLKKAGYQSDPQAELDAAIAKGDYTAAIDACVALLADGGMDAEVELNKRVKAKISDIK